MRIFALAAICLSSVCCAADDADPRVMREVAALKAKIKFVSDDFMNSYGVEPWFVTSDRPSETATAAAVFDATAQREYKPHELVVCKKAKYGNDAHVWGVVTAVHEDDVSKVWMVAQSRRKQGQAKGMDAHGGEIGQLPLAYEPHLDKEVLAALERIYQKTVEEQTERQRFIVELILRQKSDA